MEIHPIIDPYAIHYDTFAGDVYTLDTAGITLTAGTLTADTITDGTATLTSGDLTGLDTLEVGVAGAILNVSVIGGGAIISASLRLSAGSIKDDTGAINFDDENLSGTGTLDFGVITGTTLKAQTQLETDFIYDKGATDQKFDFRTADRVIATVGHFKVDGGGTDVFSFGAATIFRLLDGGDFIEFTPGASKDTYFYNLAANGENPELRVYGRPSGEALKYGSFSVETYGGNPYFNIFSNSSGIVLQSPAFISSDLTMGASEFEADGTLVFSGAATVFEDINLGSALLTKPASSAPDTDEFKDEGGNDTGIETYAFAPGEKVSGNFELRHNYKEGSDITFHVHFQGITAPTGTDKVKWQLIYTLTREGATLDATTTIVREIDYDTQYEFLRADFAVITGTNFLIEDQFLFQLSRITASADEYGGDALIATVGLHYEIDTIGSRAITTK